MNDPNAIDRDLERRLRRWMSEPSDDAGDARLMAAVAAQTRAMPQDRGVRARLRRSAGPVRSDGRGSRTILALAALLGTVGVAWLVGAGARPAVPERPASDMEVYPRLPVDLPAGAESGTSETPLGPARWVHLVGDLSSWPVDLRPLPGPDGGLLALDLGGSHPECEVVLEERENEDGTGWMKVEDCPSPPGLWSSDDGLTWVHHDLPARGVDALDVAGGAYWLRRSSDRSGLWRSTDGDDWTRIDLSALAPSEPGDLDWVLELGAPVTVRETTVVPVSWRARRTEIVEQLVAVIEDGAALPVPLPGEPLPKLEPGWDGVKLFAAPDAVVAFASLPEGGLRIWHSPDGRTWQEGDSLRFEGRLARDIDLSIDSRPGQSPVLVAYSAGQAWESYDGRAWHLAELDPEGDRALRVPAGWLSTGYGSLKVRAPDGEWTELGGSIVPNVGSGSGGRIGDTLVSNFVSRRGGVPRQDLWIFQFETDLPDDARPS
jgi:hypothetical protein